MVTEKEKEIIEKAGDIWSLFKELPQYHETDSREMATFIHGIQSIMLARTGRRELGYIPEKYKNEAQKEKLIIHDINKPPKTAEVIATITLKFPHKDTETIIPPGSMVFKEGDDYSASFSEIAGEVPKIVASGLKWDDIKFRCKILEA